MNRVQQRIRDQLITPAMRQLSGLRIADIREVDYANQTASIAYLDSQRADGEEIAEVSMAYRNGLHEVGPFPGDQVLIGFMNNDNKNPVIISVIDPAYSMRTRVNKEQHERQGSLISDLYTQRTGESWFGN